MVRPLLFLLLVIICLTSDAQIDPHKRDSLAAVIEGQHRATVLSQDSFLKAQDSIRQARTITPPHATEERHRERSKPGRLFFISGILLLLPLIVVLIRRRRR